MPKVSDQGTCGSCWANTGVTIMQYSVASQLNLKANFSIQELISCVQGSASGCDGGSLQAAFIYGKTYAVSDDTVYPYTSASSGVTGTCNTALTNKGSFKVTSYSTTATGNTND